LLADSDKEIAISFNAESRRSWYSRYSK